MPPKTGLRGGFSSVCAYVAEGDDLGMVFVGDVGNGSRLVMDIQADIKADPAKFEAESATSGTHKSVALDAS